MKYVLSFLLGSVAVFLILKYFQKTKIEGTTSKDFFAMSKTNEFKNLLGTKEFEVLTGTNEFKKFTTNLGKQVLQDFSNSLLN